MRENKPWLAQDANWAIYTSVAYVRHKCSYKWFTAKFTANWSKDDVIYFDVLFWDN